MSADINSKADDLPVSYSHQREDVLLWRALGEDAPGFYIDVGANHPVKASMSKLFDERGWRGLTIEPNPAFTPLFTRLRENSNHLQLALADVPGMAKFYVVKNDPALSSLDVATVEAYRKRGYTIEECEVEVSTLAKVCAEHVEERAIGFLKIDVETAEKVVLEGADFTRWRPKIVVVEAVRPYSRVQTHLEWAPILLENGYVEALFDGVNRIYVDASYPNLIERLSYPVSSIDRFTTPEDKELAEYRRLGRTARIAAQLVQRAMNVVRRCLAVFK